MILYSVLDMAPYFDPQKPPKYQILQKPTGNDKNCRHLPEMTETNRNMLCHIASLRRTFRSTETAEYPPSWDSCEYTQLSETTILRGNWNPNTDNQRKPLKFDGGRKNNATRGYNRIEYMNIYKIGVKVVEKIDASTTARARASRDVI